MTIITIASSKGGPGKTTLTELLVGSLASDGVNVAALDADPTGGLSRWASRLYEGPPFTCHHEADEARLAHLIHRVAQEAEVVLVDTAGFGNRAATVAMTAADAVLIPMVPGEGDVTEAARTVELVAGVASAARRDIPSRVVLNRVRFDRLRNMPSSKMPRNGARPLPVPKLIQAFNNTSTVNTSIVNRNRCKRPLKLIVVCPISWLMARWVFRAGCQRARQRQRSRLSWPNCVILDGYQALSTIRPPSIRPSSIRNT